MGGEGRAPRGEMLQETAEKQPEPLGWHFLQRYPSTNISIAPTVHPKLLSTICIQEVFPKPQP